MKRPGKLDRGGILPQTMQGLIRTTQSRHSCRNSSGGVLCHPPYSPDLSPCDYAIFGPLKKALRSKRFTSDDQVKQYVRNWFTTQYREFYETVIHRLVSHWDKCLNSRANTSVIQVLVSVRRPPAPFFFNASYTYVLKLVGYRKFYNIVFQSLMNMEHLKPAY